MRETLIALSLTLCITVGLLQPAAARAVGADASALKVGQVWRYDAPSGDEDSRVIIGKLETLPVLGDAVHVMITNVRLTDPETGEAVTVTIQHVPMAVSALKASLTRRDGTVTPPAEFQSGYQAWREDFNDKKVGIFAVPIKDVLASIKTAMVHRAE